MYSDKETVKNYLYNFDEKGKYIGRQFAPQVGVIHAEPIEDTQHIPELTEKLSAKKKTKKKW